MSVRLEEMRRAWPDAAEIIERLPVWCQESLVVVADVKDDHPYFAVLVNDEPSIPADPAIYNVLSALRSYLIRNHPDECASLMDWARRNDRWDIHSGDAAEAPLYHTPDGMIDGTADLVHPAEMRLPQGIGGADEGD